MLFPPCPACGLPFNDDWVKLADYTRENKLVPTFLCPRCTHGQTTTARAARELDNISGYKARTSPEREFYALVEDEEGQFEEPTFPKSTETRNRRFSELETVLGWMPRDLPHSVLHVGARDGRFLAHASKRLNLTAMGVEPSAKWSRASKQLNVENLECTLEDLAPPACDQEKFDVVVEHFVLQNLPDPRRHLKLIRNRLHDDGVAIIEVPNLLQAYGAIEKRFLQIDHRQVFTPRSLVTMCQRAGLTPVHIDAQANMRIFCRVTPENQRNASLPDGPNVHDIYSAAWANDVRLTLKRALINPGPTPDVLSIAERTIDKCTWAPGRADLALEVAVALEREKRYRETARWLRRSLGDRSDGEVRCMLERVELLIRAQEIPEQSRKHRRRDTIPNLWNVTPIPSRPGIASLRN